MFLYAVHSLAKLAGGGVALLRAALALKNLKGEGDEQVGINIVTRACEEPVRQIVGNAGHEGAIIIEKIRGKTTRTTASTLLRCSLQTR